MTTLHDGVTGPVTELEWWTDRGEVAATLHLLHRAGVLPGDQSRDFMEKPWKWSKERTTCRTIEKFMAECGVTADRGWAMTLREVVEEGCK